jgi:Asp-tRNA(Asn)/Glu-tRNA(Gln) amidotransferase A subunit family amidase
MGKISEYSDFDGMGLAELVKKKEVTPNELLEEAISRAEKHKNLNAIIYPMYDIAIEYLKNKFLIKGSHCRLQRHPHKLWLKGPKGKYFNH